MGTLARGSLRARVASVIWELTTGGSRRTVWITQQEIASRIGTRREEVNRVMQELCHLSLISCPSRGCIAVLDLGRLALEARHSE